MFHRFSKVSNLHLNLPRSVIVPLWAKGVNDARYMMQTQTEHRLQHRRELLKTDITSHRRYFGFMEGPCKGSHSWDKPLTKYVSASNVWAKEKAGLHIIIKAKNTYAIPVLSLVGQLESPSDGVPGN
jgi:hypothetical protein